MRRLAILSWSAALLAALGCGGDDKKKEPTEPVPPPDKRFDKSKAPGTPQGKKDKGTAG